MSHRYKYYRKAHQFDLVLIRVSAIMGIIMGIMGVRVEALVTATLFTGVTLITCIVLLLEAREHRKKRDEAYFEMMKEKVNQQLRAEREQMWRERRERLEEQLRLLRREQ